MKRRVNASPTMFESDALSGRTSLDHLVAEAAFEERRGDRRRAHAHQLLARHRRQLAHLQGPFNGLGPFELQLPN